MQNLLLPGHRQAVLLLHDLDGHPLELLPLARRLHAAGHTVNLPNLQRTTSNANTATANSPIGQWESNALAHLCQLNDSQQNAILVGGAGFGGTLALQLAAQHSNKVSGLLLAGAALHLTDIDPNWQWRLLPFQPTSKTPLSTTKALTLSDLRDIWVLLRKTRASLAKIPQPALILQARHGKTERNGLLEGLAAESLEIHTLNGRHRRVLLDGERDAAITACISFAGRQDQNTAQQFQIDSAVA